MEEPCGNPRKPETLPLEQVCEALMMQLKQQVMNPRPWKMLSVNGQQEGPEPMPMRSH